MMLAAGGGGAALAVYAKNVLAASAATSASQAASSAIGSSLRSGQSRDPTQQPFSSQNVWNVGIGSGAKWSYRGDADTKDLTFGVPAINAGEWSMPYYVGSHADPLVTVKCTDKGFPYGSQSIHMPAGAAPAKGGDAHMNFFDVTKPEYMWSYWGCNGNTSTGFTAGLGARDNVCSSMPPSDYNFGIGTMRTWELNNGVINHALRFALPVNLTMSPGHKWDWGIPWPMTHEDYFGPKEYKGKVMFASTIGIPSTVDLSKLRLSKNGLILATALQKYGAMMRDTSGNNPKDGLVFYAEPDMENNAIIQDMRHDLPTIQSHLRILRNQSQNTVNGGGVPIVDPLPPVHGC